MIGKTLLHYTILSELGSGAMGRVYLARDTLTDRRVAIKILAGEHASGPDSRARLMREAQAAARLSHPNIVTLLAAEQLGDDLFLVEEVVDGETLASRLSRGPLGPQETLRLARELTAALAHAHAHGVVHRDLKPENVLIAGDGAFKIVDFGIARMEGAATITRSGTLVGSLPYLSPERVRGHSGDARSDLFALGAILYEAISGRRAFGGSSEAEVMHAILNEDPPPIETRNAQLAALEQLARRLMAKEPRERPASTEVVTGVLQGFDTAPRRAKARAWLAPVVILAALAVAALIWAIARMRPAAAAPAPSVAVLYFENVKDPEDRDRLGPITGNLLVTSLAQSSDINVLGTERILDVLRQLGHEGRKLDRGVALEVARRAHASRLVSGSILQSTPNLVMTAELIDVKSGRVVDAYRVVGEPGQTVFQVVDQLGRRLVSRFASPSEATRLVSVSERASSDLEAVRRYLEGLEQLSHGQFDLAARAFESALERDPDFAQAHYQLAIARWWSSEPENAESELRDAENHQDRLSRAEREALQGIRALVEGRWKNAAEIFQSRLRMDPGDKLALYGLVEASFHGNDYQGAIDAGRRALSVDSSFTLVSVHVVDAAAASHHFALAESVARAGLRISPGNDPLWASYARSLLMKGDGDGALRVVNDAIASGRRDLTVLGAAVVLAMGLDSLAAARRYFDVVRKMPLPAFMLDEIPPMERYGMALRGGRFREAEAIAAERWRLWRRPPPLPRSAGPRIPAADGIDAAVGARDTKLAWLWADSIAVRVDRWRGSVTPSPGTSVRGITSIRLGRLDDARRELARLEAMPGYEREPAGADYLRGLIRAEEGKTDEALALIAAGNAGGPPGRQIGTKWLDTYRVLAAAGRHVQALSVLDTLIAAPVVSPADAVRLIFYRGQTLEHLGRTAEARSSYQRFLRAWEHADPGIPEVEEARAALRRLGTESQASKTTSLR